MKNTDLKTVIKIRKKVFDSLLLKIFKLALIHTRKRTDMTISFYCFVQRIELRDKESNQLYKIRLEIYAFEYLSFDGGQNLLDYYNKQIYTAKEIINYLETHF